MIRYIAFLRGINISGKNKIAMKDLKKSFEKEYFDVATYLNSGNVMFSTSNNDINQITNNIKSFIISDFSLNIEVYVINIEELTDIINNAPTWWGTENKEIYDNLIFIIPPTDYNQVHTVIGEPKEQYEKIFNYKNAIFWSFVLKSYTKTNWIKTASSSINNNVTIRTANTIKKILELSKVNAI